MKKVFYVTFGLLLGFTALQAQEIASVDLAASETVDVNNSSSFLINDYRGIEEIRDHILQDKRLSKVFSEYVTAGKMEVEVTVDNSGYILLTRVVNGLTPEHDLSVRNSLKKLKKIQPIKINGVKVKQKVMIPIQFKK